MKNVFLSTSMMVLLAMEAVAGDAVSIDLNTVPLPAALTRLQDASGLRLAFAADLVRDAEPVTVSAKDEPVDAVLLRILRPCGLECIYTGETMAAIVRADSDVGMAKAAGRAIRTLARLASKIQSARQVGDEIVMPEWEEGDDRALAEAVAEVVRATNYFAQGLLKAVWSYDYDSAYKAVMEMLDCFDGNVRLGAAIAARTIGHRLLNESLNQRLADCLAKVAGDPDPLVRAAGIAVKATALWKYNRNDSATIERELRGLMADRAPEVRFTAALAALEYYYRDQFDPEILGGSRADPHAAVRAIAWLGPAGLRDIRQPDLLAVSMGLRDGNPIVRTICLGHMVRLLHYQKNSILSRTGSDEIVAELLQHDPGKLHAAMKAVGVESDPWLTVAAEAVLAGSTFVWSPYLSARMAGKGDVPPHLQESQDGAVATTTGMLDSGKRSHAMLACAVLLNTWQINRSYRGGLQLPPLGGRADSADLLTRLAAIVACGSVEPEQNAARLLKALDSPDELERLAALWGVCLAQPKSAPPALQRRLIDLMHDGRCLESSLATRTLGSILPFDRALALLLDQCRRQPGSVTATQLLRTIIGSLPFARPDDTAGQANQMMLLDVVLESHDAALQADFIRNAYYLARDNQPLVLTYIIESDVQAFYELVQRGSMVIGNSPGTGGNEPSRAFAVDAVLKRLEGLVRRPDGTMDPEAVTAFGRFFGSSSIDVSPAQAGHVFDAITPLLEGCFGPGAPEADVAACGDLVQCVVGKLCVERRPEEQSVRTYSYADGRRGYDVDTRQTPCVKWRDLPSGIREACRRFLGYVNHEVHGARAFGLLRACCYRLAGQPPGEVEAEMLDAFATARAAVMENGTPADQVGLLASMAWMKDEALRAKAIAELQARIAAGTVPPDKRAAAYRALAHGAQFLAPEFAQSLLERIADPREDAELRRLVSSELLSRQTGFYQQFLPLYGNLLTAEPNVFDCSWTLPRLILNLRKLSKEKQPLPPWAKAAADLGFKIARSPSEREVGEMAIDLVAAAAGADAAPELEALAQDATLDAYTRAAAARSAVGLNPGTTLLVALAGDYEELPVEMREQLAKCSARAPDTPGAEALFLRCLNDRDILERNYIFSLRLPPTPLLIGRLKELTDDPRIGSNVEKLIERLQKPKE
ncbi:MAG TPA: hypothetical protein VM223_04135 [Planctomycetota bacterium]|nr:hypothetical protein [Planctomycetota bacterium]